MQIGVGFAKDDFHLHKGISGLKYYLIIMYLRKHLEPFGEVCLSLNKLMAECGYSTKSHNQSVYNDFRNILKEEVIDKGIAQTDVDILNISPTTFFSLFLTTDNLFFISNKKPFVLLTIHEYEIITSAKSSVNKSVLAGVFLYIKQFISVGDTATSVKVAFPSKTRIMHGLGLSSATTVESAIKVLLNINILFMRSKLYIRNKNDDGYIPTRNVFALDNKELDIDECIRQLESFYGKTVYQEADVPIEEKKFLTKK